MKRARWASFILFCIVVFPASGQENQDRNVNVAVKNVDPFLYSCLSYKGPISDIPEVIGSLLETMQSQNIIPMGPMVGIFYGDPASQKPESAEWEVGFPVIEQALVQAPLMKKSWIFETVAWAIHIGPYAETPKTIDQILRWMEANGYKQNGPVLEQYTMDPETTGEGTLETEIWIPCIQK